MSFYKPVFTNILLMKLDEIKEIKIRHREQEVNKELKQGYSITRILQSKNGENLYPCFVLAK